MSESTDDVVVMPLPSTLPEVLAALHQLIEAENPRVVLIDRDQGTIMVVGRGTEYTPEFNDLSLAFLLNQVPIVFVQGEELSAYALLVEHARVAQLQVTRFCAHPDDRAALEAEIGDVLWTPTVSQGSLLLVCRDQSGAWSLLAADILRSTTSA